MYTLTILCTADHSALYALFTILCLFHLIFCLSNGWRSKLSHARPKIHSVWPLQQMAVPVRQSGLYSTKRLIKSTAIKRTFGIDTNDLARQ